MNANITVVVPIHNVEGELRRCLNSILKQTYQDWKCLLIDDGSTDSSGKLCDEYAKKDIRFEAIHIKHRGGVSAARNYGIEKIRYNTTKYIAFVDADDWLSEDYLSFLLGQFDESTDMVMCHAVCEYPNSSVEHLKVCPSKIIFNKSEKDKLILSSINRGYASKILFQEQGFLNTVWGKLYRSSVIIKNNIVFDTKINWMEDQLFNMLFFYHANRIIIDGTIKYHYRMRTTSAVHSFSNLRIENNTNVLYAVMDFINTYYAFDGIFLEAFYSLVNTTIFNVMKNYFYNKDYLCDQERNAHISAFLGNEPYKSALKELCYKQIKNIEVYLVAMLLKYKFYFSVKFYFRLRNLGKKIRIFLGRRKFDKASYS